MIERSALLEKIRLGEDSILELKEVRIEGGRVVAPHPDGLADELSAFANARGGLCVLGVEDKTRQVLGIDLIDLDRVEQFVHAACHDRIDPPLAPHIERLWLADGAVVSAIPEVKVTHPLAKVTHEAAIGSVDGQQLETLMARGLDPEQAVDLIIKGMLS